MDIGLAEITLAVSLLTQQQVDVREDDLICMARNVYHEARGESIEGQIAVAHVTLNRVEADRFPDTVCDVVFQEQQFSWTKDDVGRPDEWEAYQLAMLLSIEVLSGATDDPTAGADHYYAPDKANPHWAEQFTELAVLGSHRFMKE